LAQRSTWRGRCGYREHAATDGPGEYADTQPTTLTHASDGASDHNQDLGGFDSDAHGGDDCDDVAVAVSPDADETWYDDGWTRTMTVATTKIRTRTA